MDIDQVSVSKPHIRALGTDHGEIFHDTYFHKDKDNPKQVKETIRFWVKDTVYEVSESVEGMVVGYHLDPKDIDFIHVCHGGDHGKEKFRFAIKVVMRMKNGDYYDDVFGISDVACRKDHPEILDNTCLPKIIEDINSIENKDFIFTKEGESDLYTMDWIDTATPTTTQKNSVRVKPINFLAGDLAFLAVMMGKENFSAAWCSLLAITEL